MNDDKTAIDLDRRLAAERRQIEEARADIAAGRFISDENLDIWLDAWVDGKERLPSEMSRDPRRMARAGS